MAGKEEVVDTSDYKLDKHGKKIKAHRLVFNKGEDDGKKGISEMKKTYKDFVEQHSVEEELKGKQHKLDKNKNGKLDKHDFELLRKEAAEQVDEAQSHQAKTTMKHVSNPTAGEKKAAKDIKPGVAGYLDRIAMLKSAQARGALKKEEAELEEGWDDMLAHAKKVATTSKTSTATKHDVKKTSTGTVYTKQRDADGMSKEFKRDTDQAKRGRGRPKKNSFGEAVEFLMGLDEEAFDSMMEEGFDSFMEEFEQLDELDKKTLGSYAKKAKTDVALRSYDQGSDDEMGAPRSKYNDRKLGNRLKGVNKAVDRLTK